MNFQLYFWSLIIISGTAEGVAGVDDAIRFLRAQAPVSQLTASAGLTAAAQLGAKHTCSTGSESSNSLEQVSQFGMVLYENSFVLLCMVVWRNSNMCTPSESNKEGGEGMGKER